MHTEHHIDSFDLESFFKLHDLDLNGFWDVAEVEAVYGLHHHSVKERLPQKGLQEGRASVVVEKVLKRLDTNGDRRISLEEFLAGGNDGLPSFEGYKDLGRESRETTEADVQIITTRNRNSELRIYSIVTIVVWRRETLTDSFLHHEEVSWLRWIDCEAYA